VILRRTRPASRSRVAVNVPTGGRGFEVTFESASPLAASGDVDLVLSLQPAMMSGEDLKLATSVSPRLLSNATSLQEFFCSLDRHSLRADRHRGYRPIMVDAATAVPLARARGVATFFNGRVDSIYSAIKHRDELSGLVFVAEGLRAATPENVHSMATTIGLPLVEVRVDLDGLAFDFVTWGDYNGAILAAVAHLLRDSFTRFYVPTALTYSLVEPAVTDPATDTLWSAEDVELVHDGLEANRLEKIELIAARAPELLADLHVCAQNVDGGPNCGCCEKCVRTMIALRLAGATDLCHSLPPVAAAVLDDIAPPDNQRPTWEQMCAAAHKRDPDLAQALDHLAEKPST